MPRASKHSLAFRLKGLVLEEQLSLVWDVLLSYTVLVVVCCCQHQLSFPVLPCPLVFWGQSVFFMF